MVAVQRGRRCYNKEMTSVTCVVWSLLSLSWVDVGLYSPPHMQMKCVRIRDLNVNHRSTESSYQVLFLVNSSFFLLETCYSFSLWLNLPGKRKFLIGKKQNIVFIWVIIVVSTYYMLGKWKVHCRMVFKVIKARSQLLTYSIKVLHYIFGKTYKIVSDQHTNKHKTFQNFPARNLDIL